MVKSQRAVGVKSRKVDAIVSLRELDIQQTAVLEAKYACDAMDE